MPAALTQEGRFHLHAERTTGLQTFNCQRPCRLTLAELQGGTEDGLWVVYNVGDYLHIARYDATQKASSSYMHHAPCSCCSTGCVWARRQGGTPQLLMPSRSNTHLRLAACACTLQDPVKSIHIASAVRTGYPLCHAFLPQKDGNDFLVGLGDGTGGAEAAVPTDASALPSPPPALP